MGRLTRQEAYQAVAAASLEEARAYPAAAVERKTCLSSTTRATNGWFGLKSHDAFATAIQAESKMRHGTNARQSLFLSVKASGRISLVRLALFS